MRENEIKLTNFFLQNFPEYVPGISFRMYPGYSIVSSTAKKNFKNPVLIEAICQNQRPIHEPARLRRHWILRKMRSTAKKNSFIMLADIKIKYGKQK